VLLLLLVFCVFCCALLVLVGAFLLCAIVVHWHFIVVCSCCLLAPHCWCSCFCRHFVVLCSCCLLAPHCCAMCSCCSLTPPCCALLLLVNTSLMCILDVRWHLLYVSHTLVAWQHFFVVFFWCLSTPLVVHSCCPSMFYVVCSYYSSMPLCCAFLVFVDISLLSPMCLLIH